MVTFVMMSKSKRNFPKITLMPLILKEMQCCIYNKMKYSNVTQYIVRALL